MCYFYSSILCIVIYFMIKKLQASYLWDFSFKVTFASDEAIVSNFLYSVDVWDGGT